MYFRSLIVFILLVIHLTCAAGQNMRQIENNAFQKGETLNYRLYYDSFLPGYITVGDGSMKINENNVTIGNRNTMQITGTARSRRFFNLFFRVDNHYETYIDEKALIPWYFMRDVSEGGYKRNESTTFNHYDNQASFNGKTISTPDYIQDIISAFYFARTFDYSNIEPGDEFEVSFLFKDSVYITKIVFEGREKIKTRMGDINTMRFKPKIKTGSEFEQPWPMTLWISDDKNKIPVLFETRVIVGFAKMEIAGYKGLKHPFTAKTD